MSIDKNTCWYQNCTDKMNEFYQKEVKPFTKKELIGKFYHLFVFQDLIHGLEKLYTLDLACGTGATSMFFENYIGADLPEVIDNSARKNFPDIYFCDCDLETDSLEWIESFDLIVLNAILDVMQNPLEILSKILSNATQYVLIHRQEITKGKTDIIKNASYGGYTYHSIINETEFLNLIKTQNLEIIKKQNLDYYWENGGNSYLLKRIST